MDKPKPVKKLDSKTAEMRRKHNAAAFGQRAVYPAPPTAEEIRKSEEDNAASQAQLIKDITPDLQILGVMNADGTIRRR